MEEPDFDDLINDDFEDAFDAPPPTEYDEDFMEDMMMAQANESTGVSSSTETAPSSPPRVPEKDATPRMDLEMEESLEGESSAFVRNSFDTRDGQPSDAYSFERWVKIIIILLLYWLWDE